MTTKNLKPRPARQVCPLCGSDDAIEVETLAPGAWRYTCGNERRHGARGPWSWIGREVSSPEEDVVEGKAAELGLYDDLPRCLVAGEPFVEYGIVEYRYSKLRPSTYKRLIDDYGHTRQGPKKYTASAFIASALSRLADLSELTFFVGPATGYWSYNSTISYWALAPGPEESARLTYQEFATQIGIDPQS